LYKEWLVAKAAKERKTEERSREMAAKKAAEVPKEGEDTSPPTSG
jgi:hypothetical protein